MVPFDALSARTSRPASPSTSFVLPDASAVNTPLLVPISSVIVTLPASPSARPSRQRGELSPIGSAVDDQSHGSLSPGPRGLSRPRVPGSSVPGSGRDSFPQKPEPGTQHPG